MAPLPRRTFWALAALLLAVLLGAAGAERNRLPRGPAHHGGARGPTATTASGQDDERRPPSIVGARSRLLGGAASALLLALAGLPGAAALRNDFTEWDLDGDGRLCKKEFSTLVGQLVDEDTRDLAEAARLTQWWDRIFRRADVDANEALIGQEINYFAFLAREAALDAQRLMHEEGLSLAECLMRSTHAFDDINYAALDVDGDGVLTGMEMVPAAKRLVVLLGGLDESKLDPSKLDFVTDKVEVADLSGDGTLDEREAEYLLHLLREHMVEVALSNYVPPAQEKRRAEQDLDRNGDGRLDLDELAEAIWSEDDEALSEPAEYDAEAVGADIMALMRDHFHTEGVL